VKSVHRLIRVVFIPVVGLRVIEEDEMLGLELTQPGEKAYNE
jgi:ammonia channel protein AmtB